MALILIFFFALDQKDYMSLATSLLGATALIFIAKGNPISHVIFIIFSILYAYISFTFAYYGEMFTFLGITIPLSIISLIS